MKIKVNKTTIAITTATKLMENIYSVCVQSGFQKYGIDLQIYGL